MHGILARLAAAASRAIAALSEERARPGGSRSPRKKKQRPGKVGRVNKFKNAAGSGCGTGAGGFKPGNSCQKEDGVPNIPKSFAQKGKSGKAASLPATKEALAAKSAALKGVLKKSKIASERKKAAIRKKEKEAKAAEEGKQRAEALAKKRAEMLKVIRKKRADEKLQILGDKTVDVQQISKNKAAAASKKLEVVGTPKSLAEEIAEAKAAAAAKTAAKGKPAPYRRPDTPPEPEPPSATPPPSTLTVVKTLGGSTGAKLAKGEDGKEYVIKGGNSGDHIRSESAADELYRAAGVNVPKQQVHDTPDGPQKVAEFIKGKTLQELKVSNPKQYEAAVKKLRKHFVVDALLGNRDVVGMNLDNIVVGKGGKVFRVDNGGSLTFRAQGGNKDFGPDVGKELGGLRDPSINSSAASVFGGITNKEISSQITAVMKRKESILAAAKNPELRSALEKRFDSLEKWQAAHKQSAKPKTGKFYSAPSVQKGSIDGNKDTTLSNKAEPGYSDISISSIPPGAPRTAKEWIDAKATQTHAGLPWDERRKIGEEIKKSMTPAEQDAASDWSGSSWSDIQKFESKAGPNSSVTGKYANFMSMKDKLPDYVGGVIFRKMRLSAAKVDKILNSKSYNHSKEDDISGQGVHQSFTTTYGVAHAWGGTNGSDAVIVAITKHKGTKDGVGIVGLKDETEVLPNPDAQYRVKRTYFTYTGVGGTKYGARKQKLEAAGLLPGQPLTEKQYRSYLKKAGLDLPDSAGKPASLHDNAELNRVIEMEELTKTRPGYAAKLWAQYASAKPKPTKKKK